MVSASIKSSEIRFGECNKKLLEEVIFYGISLGADFVELFIENSDNSSVLAEEDFITSVSPSFGRGAGIRIFKEKKDGFVSCLLYTSPSPRDTTASRMPSSA